MPDDEAIYVPSTPEALTNGSFDSVAAQEPAADMRSTAIQCRQFYTALVGAGFSTVEAMDLVKVIIETAARQGMGDAGE